MPPSKELTTLIQPTASTNQNHSHAVPAKVEKDQDPTPIKCNIDSNSPSLLKRAISVVTSPSTLGPAGLVAVSIPDQGAGLYVFGGALAFTVLNQLNIFDNLKVNLQSQENSSITALAKKTKDLIFSRGGVLYLGAAGSFINGTALLAATSPDLMRATAYAFSGIGCVFLGRFMNRPENTSNENQESSKTVLGRVFEVIKNPAVHFSASNGIFSALTLASTPTEAIMQITALTAGITVAGMSIARGMSAGAKGADDRAAFSDSNQMGGISNGLLALGAFVGSGYYSAAALTCWAGQQFAVAYLNGGSTLGKFLKRNDSGN